MAIKTEVYVPVNDKKLMVQPNQITYMRHDFNAVQIRAVVNVVEMLQDEIRAGISNQQLSLFENDRNLRFEVPLRKFGVQPRHYDRLKETLLKMASIAVQIPITDKDGKKYTMIKGLLTAIVPEDKYAKSVYIEMDKFVAHHFTTINIGYTQYLKEIVMTNSNKYVQRFYLLVSSFRKKPAFSLNYDTIKKLLKVEGKYSKFSDFERRVLKVAKEGLWEKSDIYFDYQVIRDLDNKNVQRIIFFLYEGIIDEKELENNKNVKQAVGKSLLSHYNLKQNYVDDIVKLVNCNNYQAVLVTARDAYDVSQNKRIQDPQAYIYVSIINSFAAEVKPEDMEVLNIDF
ncbi:replication initiation protein [Parabacteroides sp. PF5-9]|uniref:replication initiation protein n=1 Tax=Parabacteroides sp. PF5-9 TaxID=1742404 RepID=UPI002472F817|nr:replication initiation protein [Parabacteroides sp. PF5-9]MDH6358939.1 hypothetical protein [Parabacteroides sp. PF5-9]